MKTIADLLNFGLILSYGIGCAIVFDPQKTIAQVIPDNTVGTTVSPTNLINGGTKTGNNLFHSFSQFSIPINGSAIFNNPTGIQNIFSRVTGTTQSSINGLIKAQGKANLFLMNPNGILFGPNAKLDIGGSFIGTTANSIQFADGVQFSASDLLSNPLLTVSLPIGLQFGNSPGVIEVQESTLKVPNGQSFLLSGNAMKIVGNITAKGGRVDFASISGAGSVALENDAFQNLTLRTPNTTPRGNLQVGADLSTGKATVITVDNPRGGSLGITAKNFDFLGDAFIYAGVKGIGSINQKSGNLEIDVENQFYSNYAVATSRVNKDSIGNAGDINIMAGTVVAVNGAQFSASNRGRGTGGNINITARDRIDFSGQDKDGYQTSLFSSIRKGAVGNGGQITLTAPQVSFTNGASLELITEGKGNAGTVRINATESIVIQGVGLLPSPNQGTLVTSGIFSNVRELGIGNGGSIELNSPNVSIGQGAEISTSSKGIGDAGNIRISAYSVILNTGGLTAESRSGNQGNIIINASNNLILRNGSLITTNATGTSRGGNILINAPVIVGLENSDIVANAIQGQGGNIKITTESIFGLKYRDRVTSENDITASSEFGINGTVQVNSLGLDPSSGLVKLDGDVIDSSRSISKGCSANQGNSFVSTGRGGIPQNPIKIVKHDRSWTDMRTVNESTTSMSSPMTAMPKAIVEAAQIQVNSDGTIALVDGSLIGSINVASCSGLSITQ